MSLHFSPWVAQHWCPFLRRAHPSRTHICPGRILWDQQTLLNSLAPTGKGNRGAREERERVRMRMGRIFTCNFQNKWRGEEGIQLCKYREIWYDIIWYDLIRFSNCVCSSACLSQSHTDIRTEVVTQRHPDRCIQMDGIMHTNKEQSRCWQKTHGRWTSILIDRQRDRQTYKQTAPTYSPRQWRNLDQCSRSTSHSDLSPIPASVRWTWMGWARMEWRYWYEDGQGSVQ